MSRNNQNCPVSAAIHLGSPSAGVTLPALHLPFKSRIVSVMLQNGATLAGTVANYFQLLLKKGTTTIAEFDSRPAHENGITAVVPKALNLVAAESLLAAGSTLTAEYVESEGVKEISSVTCVADGGACEVTTVTFPAVADAAQGDYFTFENQAGDKFAVWLDIDANGSAPAGAQYVAATTKIEANVATGNTAIQVAAAVVAAIGAQFTDVTIVDNLDGTVTFTQDKVGTCANAVPHNTGDTGAGSIAVAIDTAGAASNLQNKYITFTKPGAAGNFYAWFNVHSEGTDPTVADKTAVEVAIDEGATAPQVATALAAAIDAVDGFASSVDEALNTKVIISNDAVGVVTDAANGPGGASPAFTVAVTQAGVDVVAQALTNAKLIVEYYPL